MGGMGFTAGTARIQCVDRLSGYRVKSLTLWTTGWRAYFVCACTRVVEANELDCHCHSVGWGDFLGGMVGLGGRAAFTWNTPSDGCAQSITAAFSSGLHGWTFMFARMVPVLYACAVFLEAHVVNVDVSRR